MTGAIPAAIFTFLLSSLVIGQSVTRFARVPPAERWRFYIYSLGLGPLCIALVLKSALFLFPRRPDAFYISAVLLVFLALFLLSFEWRSGRGSVLASLSQANHPAPPGGQIPQLLGLVIFGLAGASALFLALILPITENDPCQYVIEARLLYEAKTLDIYPFLDAERTGGYYAVAAHPIAYVAVQAWTLMLSGGPHSIGLAKVVSAFYLICLGAIVYAAVSRYDQLSGIVAAVLTILTPFLYTAAIISHIDPIRIYALFAAFVFVLELCDRDGAPLAAIAGVVCGLSMFSHSIGLLTLPLLLPVYAILSTGSRVRKLRISLLLAAVACAVGGWRYLDNFLLWGSPLGNTLAVESLPQLNQVAYVRHTRGLVSIWERLQKGPFRGFLEPCYYGLSYWLLIPSLLLFGRKVFSHSIQLGSLIVASLFYGCVTLSVALDMDIFIKNLRYLLTVQPFIVILAVSPFLALSASRRRHLFSLLLTIPVLTVSLFHSYSALHIGQTWKRLSLSEGSFLDDDWTKVSRSDFDVYRVIGYIRRETPPDGVFLVLQQNQFALYANRRYVRHADPRMLPFYRLRESTEGYEFLRALNIDYVYLPGQWKPSLYRSVLFEVLADPTLSELLYDEQFRLFRLRKEATVDNYTPALWRDHEGHAYAGLDSRFWEDIGRSGTGGPDTDIEVLDAHGTCGATLTVTNNLGRRTILHSGAGPLKLPASRCFSPYVEIRGQSDITLSGEVRGGEGLFRVYLWEYGTTRTSLRSHIIWECVLDGSVQRIANLFRVKDNASEARLGLEIRNTSDLVIRDLALRVPRLSMSVPRDPNSERWRPLVTLGEESSPSGQPLGWSTYSRGREPDWPWGLYEFGANGNAIYLERRDNESYWLCTGRGPLTDPPSSSGTDAFGTVDVPQAVYRASAMVRGSGEVGLYVYTYDKDGRGTSIWLGEYWLRDDFRRLRTEFELPEGAGEFRICFLLRGRTTPKTGSVYVRDFQAEFRSGELDGEADNAR